MTQTRYEFTTYNGASRDCERTPPTGIKRGPLAFMSLGTFMMIVWLVMLLPGQDIATWQRQQQMAQAASNNADSVICLPHLTPQTPVIVPVIGRSGFYHWRSDCPVLSPQWRSSHAPLPIMTFAQAQRSHLSPCGFCSRLDWSDSARATAHENK